MSVVIGSNWNSSTDATDTFGPLTLTLLGWTLTIEFRFCACVAQGLYSTRSIAPGKMTGFADPDVVSCASFMLKVHSSTKSPSEAVNSVRASASVICEAIVQSPTFALAPRAGSLVQVRKYRIFVISMNLSSGTLVANLVLALTWICPPEASATTAGPTSLSVANDPNAPPPTVGVVDIWRDYRGIAASRMISRITLVRVAARRGRRRSRYARLLLTKTRTLSFLRSTSAK